MLTTLHHPHIIQLFGAFRAVSLASPAFAAAVAAAAAAGGGGGSSSSGSGGGGDSGGGGGCGGGGPCSTIEVQTSGAQMFVIETRYYEDGDLHQRARSGKADIEPERQ